jgi:phosphoribosylglycinamide formyltransferase-1
MDVAVLVSGRGSNLKALLEASAAGRCAGRVTAVVTDRRRAAALRVAEGHGIPTRVVRPADYETRALWDEALAATLSELSPELVVLAGFMRILGQPVLDRFGGRIINIHPSLLPAFPGKDGPGQAIAAGVRISGCTVHVVDRGVDTGPILAQAAVAVLSGDDAESLHARIQPVEHRLLPAVVHAIATGELTLGPPARWRSAGAVVPPALVVPSSEAP